MDQARMTFEDVQRILAQIKFLNRSLRLLPKGDGYLVQLVYDEADVDHPEDPTPIEQHARKWYISPYATETEVVETVFKAARVSMDHVLKEHFLYKGRRIYSPHFSVEARIEMCDKGAFDARK